MLLGIIIGVIVMIVIVIPIIVVVTVVIIIVVCVTCGVWGGMAASRRSNHRHVETGGKVVTVAPVVQTLPVSAGQPGAYPMQPTVPIASSPVHGRSSDKQGQVHEEVDSPATNPHDPKLTEAPPPAYPATEVNS